jgi:hypothetical protein
MTKSIWLLCLAALFISITTFSCDKRNITEPRLCNEDDISGSVSWYSQEDTISFLLAMPEPGHVFACIISNSDELVRSVFNQNIEAGTHSFQWDMKNNSGKLVDEGYYAFCITSDFYRDIAWFEVKR